jgi:hypothetical protein
MKSNKRKEIEVYLETKKILYLTAATQQGGILFIFSRR